MSQYQRKPDVIEAITFDELVEIGKASGAPVYDGMAWSFEYHGQPITHENQNCYIVPTSAGTVHFERGDMLVIHPEGKFSVYDIETFQATYEKVD